MANYRSPAARRVTLDASDIGESFRRIEEAIQRSVSSDTEASLPGLVLTSANGQAWRVTVTDAGALAITPARTP